MKKIQEVRNDNKRKSLDLMRKQFRFNEIINRKNSREHELAKMIKAFKLVYDADCEVYVEAKLVGNGRADVYISDTDVAVEIVQTEKEESIIKKRGKYPCGVEIVKVSGDS